MRLGTVGHLIAHAGRENHSTPVLEFGVQLAREAQQDMALAAPMIRPIAGCVFDHPNANIAKEPSSPVSDACLALVFGAVHLLPVRHAEIDVGDLHVNIAQLALAATPVSRGPEPNADSLTNEPERGLDQRVAQVTMVVRTSAAAYGAWPHLRC